jgi:desulfoferrodoxin (superoxide reductase-like protein)
MFESWFVNFKKQKVIMMRIFMEVTIFILLSSSIALCHPPTSITLMVVDNNNVEVTITHASTDLKLHYVNKIELKVNNKIVIQKNLLFQEKETFNMVFKLPSLQEGDTVTVVAYCNQWGHREAKTIVKQQKTEELKESPISLKPNKLLD